MERLRITEAERNEIDLAEALGPNAMIDKEKEAFKRQKEKAQAFVRADGKQVGGTERVQGDVFTFLNKLFQHEMKRAGKEVPVITNVWSVSSVHGLMNWLPLVSDNHMTKEILRQQQEQIKDESVKAEWQEVLATSKNAAQEDDLTGFRKKKEKTLIERYALVHDSALPFFI